MSVTMNLDYVGYVRTVKPIADDGPVAGGIRSSPKTQIGTTQSLKLLFELTACSVFEIHLSEIFQSDLSNNHSKPGHGVRRGGLCPEMR